MPEDLKDRKGRREADLRGALDGKDIDGSSNGASEDEEKKKKRKNAVAFIPPEPADDAQLQKAIELLIGLQKAASGAIPAS